MTHINIQTQPPSDIPKEHITEESVRRETIDRLTRVDRELSQGFELADKYKNTVSIFGSARFNEDNTHYKKARELSAALSRAGYVTVTGGGGGIMEAGNRGAFEAGGETLGFNIKLPHEQVLNTYTTDSMPFKYFFTRKVILAYGATGYVYFPGGFGTMDELFEITTLIQTRKIPAAPIILVGKEFWGELDGFIRTHMLDGDKTISQGDEQIYHITDDTDEIIRIIDEYRDNGYQHTL